MESYNNSQVSSEEKTWGLIAHITPLLAMWFSAGVLGFIGGIIIWVIGKDKGPLARNAAAQSLNIQLNALIWLIPSFILLIVLIGFILVPLVLTWATVLHIIALLKTSENQIWSPPLCIQFVK